MAKHKIAENEQTGNVKGYVTWNNNSRKLIPTQVRENMEI